MHEGRELMSSVVMYGLPEGAGYIDHAHKKMRRVLEPHGYQRFVNRFPLAVNVRMLSRQLWGPGGEGFVRALSNTGKHYRMEVCSVSSRRVLEVVASIGEALAWLSPQRNGIETLWGSGEILFERRGVRRSEELHALEKATRLLGQCGLIRQGENLAVLGGSSGMEGYRFRPGGRWAHDPAAMFVVLTVYKLVPLMPGLMEGEYDPREKLLNFLAFWKGIDDDARLAYWVMSKRKVQVPEERGDLFPVWGLPAQEYVQVPSGYIGWPVAPTKASVEMLRDHLTKGSPQKWTARECKVIPWPKGMTRLEMFREGFGRSCADLVCSVHIESYKFDDRQWNAYLPKSVADAALKERITKELGIRIAAKSSGSINFDTRWIQETPGIGRRLRKMFLMLPCVQKVGEFKEGAKPKKAPPPARKFNGVVVLEA